MDNCKIHRTTLVLDVINKGEHEPLFTPPYFPFLSPIEECWSNMKENLSDKNSKKHNLPQNFVEVEDFIDWVRCSETCWDICINKENWT